MFLPLCIVRLDMYQLWVFMMDPWMGAFNLKVENLADVCNALVEWSSPDNEVQIKVDRELQSFLAARFPAKRTGATGKFAQEIKRIEAALKKASINMKSEANGGKAMKFFGG